MTGLGLTHEDAIRLLFGGLAAGVMLVALFILLSWWRK